MKQGYWSSCRWFQFYVWTSSWTGTTRAKPCKSITRHNGLNFEATQLSSICNSECLHMTGMLLIQEHILMCSLSLDVNNMTQRARGMTTQQIKLFKAHSVHVYLLQHLYAYLNKINAKVLIEPASCPRLLLCGCIWINDWLRPSGTSYSRHCPSWTGTPKHWLHVLRIKAAPPPCNPAAVEAMGTIQGM